jgi:hypothetical protein
MKKIALYLGLYASLSFQANAQQWGDYTLYSTSGSTTAKLVDTTGTATGTTTGTAFKTWSGLTGTTSYGSYIMPGGYLLRTLNASGGLSGGGMTGRIQKVNYAGTVVWDYTHVSANYNLHHDVCAMPNGNILMISYEVKTAAEATAAGSSSAIVIWSEKVIEVKPNGATGGDIVWEWHLWDHLVQDKDATKANYKNSIVNNPQLLNINYKTAKDWIHMNGIDYNPVLDQIVVSSHNLNEFYVIDHSTTTAEAASHTGGNAGKGGDFLYRWGNPASYGASGTTILNVTHDAHWVPEGYPNGGNLVAFNNGGTSTKSTVDQVKPPLNGYNYDLTLGSAYTPASYTSRIVANGKTSNKGSSQQLPNGNTLICVALSGLIHEVDPNGTTLWQINAGGDASQSSRYSKCFIENEAPAIPTVTANSTTLTSSTASSYQWFKNGQKISGATSKTYTPTSTGIYLVKTTDAKACIYQYSAGFKFSSVTGLEEEQAQNMVSLSPNPSNGMVYLNGLSETDNYAVSVTDLLGNQLLQTQNTNSVDLSTFKSGVYFVSIQSSKLGRITKKVTLDK